MKKKRFRKLPFCIRMLLLQNSLNNIIKKGDSMNTRVDLG